MAACTNNGGSIAKRAVTAALVGVLSVGTVPMVALAEGVSDGIQTLVAGDVEDVAAGKITGYTDQDGKAVSSTEFKVNDGGKAQYLVPTEVTTKTGQVRKVDGANIRTVYYKVVDSGGNYTLADGTKLQYISDPKTITGQGVYYVGVYNAKDFSGNNINEVCLLEFNIVNKKLDGAYVAEAGDVNDTTIEYTGENQATDLSVVLDGKALTFSKDFNVAYYVAGANKTTTDVTDAGNYIMRVFGAGDYAGSIIDIPFTVQKLDLSTASVEVSDASGLVGTDAPTSVAKAGELKDLSKVKLTFVSATNGSLAPNTTQGAYTYKVEAADSDNASIVNSTEVTVVRYAKTATFSYDGTSFTGTKNVTDFDASKISVKGDKADLDYDLVYTKDGKVVSADEANLPGTYSVKIIAKDSSYNYGGEASITFTVSPKGINGDDVYVTYDGKVTGNNLQVTYDGTDFLDDLKISATDVNGDEVPAGELVFKVTKDNKDVDEIVDAGNYTVTVAAKDGSMYTVNGNNTFTVAVAPITPAGVKLGGTVTSSDATVGEFLPYTGSVIEPAWTFVDKDGNAIEVPADAWEVSYSPDEVKESGTYTATFSNAEGVVNYDVSALKNVTFKVAEAKSFADVKAGSWYVAPVYQAKENGFIHGMSGTNLFAPEAQISRADAVCIIFNMAGGDNVLGDNMYTENGGWVTGFDDVDGNAYYAKALAWAHNAGVVNGYDGNFRPTDKVTREELAAMLANYAKATGDYEATDGSSLAGMSDASTVSDWAEGVVDWAVENGIMGNGGYVAGKSSIIRAEVAAMAVNYADKF